jgi:hypothetical protein
LAQKTPGAKISAFFSSKSEYFLHMGGMVPSIFGISIEGTPKILNTEWKNLYSLILAKILKIKSQIPAILDCAAIWKDFQKRSSTKY